MPTRAHVVLPEDLLLRIDRVIGKRKRSRFLVEAAEEKLERDRLRAAIDAAAGAWKPEDHPEWKRKGGAAAAIREMRKDWDRRGKKR
jgi:hypothetical protein